MAVSGGADSLALLHLLHRTHPLHRLELVVAHVDHGIHPDSAAVASAVIGAADALGLRTIVGRLRLGPDASETTARKARHGWLQQVRRTEEADAIAYAHHQDDQVETILMRALGGSGPAGLAGMAPRQGHRVRPLLGFRRAELAAWLSEAGIAGWEDPANSDPAHERSWLRYDLLPRLEARTPGAGDRLLRLGRQAAADREAWRAVLDLVPGLDFRGDGGRVSVAALPLVTCAPTLAIALLQAAARSIGCVLGESRADRVLGLLRRGASGRHVELGGSWRAELSFGRLCFYQIQGAPPPLRLAGERGTRTWGGWLVRWQRAPAPAPGDRDGRAAWFIGEEAVLRAPEPGDRLLPLGGAGHRSVSRLLQEARVERSRRAGWPLVVVYGAVAWVAGVCRGEAALPAEGERSLRIEVSGG
ncbi:MAG TPA: tRNA lysidine(34) synthetase TilS [Gemmatimonadales bacterium]|nr:tRNA lysidine(34) synthetase TilS [Gemmatimonadales bacterium]